MLQKWSKVPNGSKEEEKKIKACMQKVPDSNLCWFTNEPVFMSSTVPSVLLGEHDF
jgi:hypothetical protein